MYFIVQRYLAQHISDSMSDGAVNFAKSAKVTNTP